MLRCAGCDRPIRECCDIYVVAMDTTTGEEAVLCGECAAALEAEVEIEIDVKEEKEDPEL